MRAGGGASKGAGWERACCKDLSLKLGSNDTVVWRTSLSGGRTTLQLREGIVNRAQAGDIGAVSREGLALCERCYFECKHYKDLQLTALVTRNVGKLCGFWQATVKTAERVGKIPVLIAKQNNYPAFVFCPIGAMVFTGHPLVTFHALGAELHDFANAVLCVEPRRIIRRPTQERADAR